MGRGQEVSPSKTGTPVYWRITQSLSLNKSANYFNNDTAQALAADRVQFRNMLHRQRYVCDKGFSND